MKILILGGAGFLGSNLTRYCLLDESNEITTLDSLDPTLKSTKENLLELSDTVTFLEGDIRDTELINSIVRGKDVIFNCAAQSSHPLSMTDPLFDADINCKGHLAVLEAVRQFNPEAQLIFPSSTTVLGRSYDPFERPLDIYSANKLAAENYYRIYAQVHGLKTTILRFSNLYGPYGKGDSEFGFLNHFISLAYEDKPITIFGTGHQKRNVLFVEDAAQMMYRSIGKTELVGVPFFAVSEEHYSVLEIAETIIDVTGTSSINQAEWPAMRKRMDVDDVYLSGEELFQILKWKPEYQLRTGLEKTIEILKLNGVFQ